MPHYHHLLEATAEDLLSWASHSYGPSLAICTSFQAEGMVIVDMAARLNREVRVVTVDTGRMPEETYQMIDMVRSRYGIAVETVLPDAAEVEEMVRQHGTNLFYREVPQRLLCCQVRKVRPLERKLKEFRAWAVGLRRSQSRDRAAVPKIEETDGRLKLSPLADWSRDQVEDYSRRHDVPRHPLYERGYTSIGCAPCTRATDAGENERAGRWWWEAEAPKECGIHFSANGAARRRVDVLVEEVLRPRRPAVSFAASVLTPEPALTLD